MKVGAGITCASNRIAPATANSIATLNAIAPGRALGFGSGSGSRAALGLPPLKLGEVRKQLEVIRLLFRIVSLCISFDYADSVQTWSLSRPQLLPGTWGTIWMMRDTGACKPPLWQIQKLGTSFLIPAVSKSSLARPKTEEGKAWRATYHLLPLPRRGADLVVTVYDKDQKDDLTPAEKGRLTEPLPQRKRLG